MAQSGTLLRANSLIPRRVSGPSTTHVLAYYIVLFLSSYSNVDWLKQYFETQLKCDKKSSEKAALERLAGNKLFQKKQYRGSLEKYTEVRR